MKNKNNFLILNNYDRRMFIINGESRDYVILQSGILLRFDQFIHYYLKKVLNYRLVAFIDVVGMYFLDEMSAQDLMKIKSIAPQKKLSPNMLNRPHGITTLNRNVAGQREELRMRYHFHRSFTEILMRIEQFMKNSAFPTAIVFYDSTIIERELSAESNNYFKGLIDTVFPNLPIENKNIMIFVENESNPQVLSTKFFRINLSNLFSVNEHNEIAGNAGYIHVGLPEKDEFLALLNRKRLLDDVQIDILNMDKLAAYLNGYSKQRSRNLRGVFADIDSFKQINIKTISGLMNEAIKTESAWVLLQKNIVGMDKVKDEIRSLIKGIPRSEITVQGFSSTLAPNRFLKQIHKKKPNIEHLALLGNPGTGKTTIAKLIGNILFEEGVLKIGHTIKVTRRDLVAEHVGGTAVKTYNMINKALGGVLFIDEAYALVEDQHDQFGIESLNILVEAMTDLKGELIIIMAGYPTEMNKLFTYNAGLSRRIKRMMIDDYNAEELAEIFRIMVTDISIEQDFSDKIVNYTNQMLANRELFGGEHFGNAGSLETVIESAKKRSCERHNGKIILSQSDFDNPHFFNTPYTPSNNNILLELDELIGLKKVKSKIHTIVNRLQVKKLGKSGIGHFLFLGKPGTGKTTVANLIAKQFYHLGVLKSSKCISRTASDLIASHVGGTEEIVDNVLNDAINGVLFIDEAHQLISSGSADHSYGKQALNKIVPFIENHRHDFVLIFAGYPDQIENLFKYDPGLKSRFKHRIIFDDYNSNEMLHILIKMLKEDELSVQEKHYSSLMEIFEKIKQSELNSFANARSVRNFKEKLVDAYVNRIADSNESSSDTGLIIERDIEFAMEEYINEL